MSEPEKPLAKPTRPFGGPQPGSGRKPKLLTALLLTQESAAEDIAYAYRLFANTMRDQDAETELRLDCGRELMNRLCGKPPQAVELSGTDGEPLGLDMARLQLVIMDALSHHPEARVALSQRLREIAGGPTDSDGNGPRPGHADGDARA